MADLRLQVLLDAVDKASKPFRAITAGSKGVAGALRETTARLKELNRSQADVAAFRKLSGDARQTGAQLNAAQQRVAALAGQIKAAGTPTKALSRDFDRARAAAAKLKDQHRGQSAQLQGLRQRLTAAGISTRNLSESERQLRTQTQAATRAIADQKRRLETLARAQAKMRATQQTATKIGAVGFGAAFAGRRALTGLGNVLAPGVEFEAAISSVQALTRLDKGDSGLQALRDQARELGATTAFTATDAARGQAFLAMAGFTPESIRQALPAVLNTALAGGLELDRAADIISNISSAFGIDPSRTNEVADSLALAFTSSNTSLEQLGESMKFVAPVAKAAGIDLQTTAAMAGLLGDIGIQASLAGTTLRESLSRISDTGGPAADALEGIGVSAVDSQGNLRNIIEIMNDVGEATKDLGSGDRLTVFTKIFGKRAAGGLVTLIEREGEGALTRFVAALRNAEGTAERVAKIKADNLAGDLKTLRSAAEDVSVTIADVLNPDLRGLAAGITDTVRRIGEWAKRNPGLVRALALLAGGLSAVVTVLGGLAVAVGSVLFPLAAIRFAFTSVGLAAPTVAGAINKIGLVLRTVGQVLLWFGRVFLVLGRALLLNPIGLIITAIAGAAFLIYKYWGPISAFAKRAWGATAGFVSSAWTSIEGAVTAGTSAVGSVLRARWQETMALASRVWGAISGFVSSAWTSIKGAVTAGTSAVGSFMSARFASAVATVRRAFDGLKVYFGGVWDVIAGIFTGNWQRVQAGAGTAMSGLLASITAVFGDLPRRFVVWGGQMIDGLIVGIKAKAGAVKDAVVGTAGAVGDWFAGALGINSPSRVFAGLGQDTLAGLAVGLRSATGEPLAAMAGVARRLQQAGAGLAISTAAALPAAAFDTRPPVSAAPAAAPAGATIGPITININAAPGSDAAAIARAVRAEIERLDRERSARRRSRLGDID